MINYHKQMKICFQEQCKPNKELGKCERICLAAMEASSSERNPQVQVCLVWEGPHSGWTPECTQAKVCLIYMLHTPFKLLATACMRLALGTGEYKHKQVAEIPRAQAGCFRSRNGWQTFASPSSSMMYLIKFC